LNPGRGLLIHVGAAGDLWLAAGATILHGQAGPSPTFQQQDSVGLEPQLALGGGGLLWAIGENGLLLRSER
jgi:hypothetical protein